MNFSAELIVIKEVKDIWSKCKSQDVVGVQFHSTCSICFWSESTVIRGNVSVLTVLTQVDCKYTTNNVFYMEATRESGHSSQNGFVSSQFQHVNTDPTHNITAYIVLSGDYLKAETLLLLFWVKRCHVESTQDGFLRALEGWPFRDGIWIQDINFPWATPNTLLHILDLLRSSLLDVQAFSLLFNCHFWLLLCCIFSDQCELEQTTENWSESGNDVSIKNIWGDRY